MLHLPQVDGQHTRCGIDAQTPSWRNGNLHSLTWGLQLLAHLCTGTLQVFWCTERSEFRTIQQQDSKACVADRTWTMPLSGLISSVFFDALQAHQPHISSSLFNHCL